MALTIKDLRLESPDFEQGGRLDPSFSQDGGNLVPRLRVSGVPAGTVELAIICHDPDAPLPNGFTHWTLYGIPADTERIDRDADTAFVAGPNGAGGTGYTGPQPPPGHGVHHYYFWVYALDTGVDAAPSREEFLTSYAGNILEQNRLVGLFER